MEPMSRAPTGRRSDRRGRRCAQGPSSAEPTGAQMLPLPGLGRARADGTSSVVAVAVSAAVSAALVTALLTALVVPALVLGGLGLGAVLTVVVRPVVTHRGRGRGRRWRDVLAVVGPAFTGVVVGRGRHGRAVA